MKNYPKKKKLNWTEFYIGLAFVISQKSPDAQTKHGCVIVNQQNQPLGFGYNGFPRGVDDDSLPNTRPEKYDWIWHSEQNAVANCQLRPENGIAYVTGQCCNHCLYALWQHGIKTVYMAKRKGWEKDKEEEGWMKEFIEKTGIKIHYVEPNLTWLENIGNFVNVDNFYEV